MNIRVADYDCINPAGSGISAIRHAITNGTSGLRRNDVDESQLNTWIGKVDGIDHIDLGGWQSRNNALKRKHLLS